MLSEVLASVDEQQEGAKNLLSSMSEVDATSRSIQDASREMEEESGKVFSRMDELRTAASEITILTAGIKNSIEEISRQAQKSSEESDTNSDLNAKVLDLLKSYKV